MSGVTPQRTLTPTSVSVPLPSTFNPEGVSYKIEEVDPGDAHANSVTPDSFVLNGHKNETISITIENTFAAISLEKTVSATSVLPNGELNYGLIAENTGALTLDPVRRAATDVAIYRR